MHYVIMINLQDIIQTLRLQQPLAFLYDLEKTLFETEIYIGTLFVFANAAPSGQKGELSLNKFQFSYLLFKYLNLGRWI